MEESRSKLWGQLFDGCHENTQYVKATFTEQYPQNFTQNLSASSTKFLFTESECLRFTNMDMEESSSKLWGQLFDGCHENHNSARPAMLSINLATKSMPEIRTLATFSKLVMQHSTAQPAVIGGEAAHKAMLELGQLYDDLEKGVRNVSPYESVRTLDHCITQLTETGEWRTSRWCPNCGPVCMMSRRALS